MPDNRAMRRRQTMREMRALLEQFVAHSPEHIVLGDNTGGPDVVCCFYCARDWSLFSDLSDHAPDCVYRQTHEWLARRKTINEGAVQ